MKIAMILSNDTAKFFWAHRVLRNSIKSFFEYKMHTTQDKRSTSNYDVVDDDNNEFSISRRSFLFRQDNSLDGW